MPNPYKGLMVPVSSDLADGPAAFRDYTDSLPKGEFLAAATVPVGSIVTTVRTAAPTNWLLLDGTKVVGAQALYPELWGIVPASWRDANGVDLLLPDARGRILIGMNGADALIDTIGEKAGAAGITAANLPPHSHTQQGTVNTGGESVQHVHVTAAQFVNTQPGGGIYAGGIGGSAASFTANNNVGHTHAVTLSGETANGPGTSAPFLPPVIAFNYIMRAA